MLENNELYFGGFRALENMMQVLFNQDYKMNSENQDLGQSREFFFY